MSSSMPTSFDLVSVPDFGGAYTQLLPEVSKIPEAECLPVNTDVDEAGNTALWAATRMETLRTELAARFPDYVAYLNELVPAAQGLLESHVNHSAALTPPEAIPELEAKLIRLRAILSTDVQGLVLRGILAQKDVPETQGSANSHRNLAFGTASLVNLLRNNWDRVKGRTAVSEDELEEAKAAAQRLGFAVTVRERGESALGTTGLIRRQFFTHLMQRYEFLRQAFGFLRWHEGDADKFAPSLYVNQRSRRRTVEEEVSAPPPASAAVGGAPGPSAAPTVGFGARPASNDIPVGLPGSSPTD